LGVRKSGLWQEESNDGETDVMEQGKKEEKFLTLSYGQKRISLKGGHLKRGYFASRGKKPNGKKIIRILEGGFCENRGWSKHF